jgi:hypothetical protein
MTREVFRLFYWRHPVPQREFTEGELALARKLGEELAEKTRESLLNPYDIALAE